MRFIRSAAAGRGSNFIWKFVIRRGGFFDHKNTSGRAPFKLYAAFTVIGIAMRGEASASISRVEFSTALKEALFKFRQSYQL